MRLLIVTDAWHPQVNGVVRTLDRMRLGLIADGAHVEVLGPSGLMLPCPTYPEIRLTLTPSSLVAQYVSRFEPTAIHIATEGPLGLAARSFCLARGLPLTTSFHTRFPEYLKMRFMVPRRWTYNYLQLFHLPARRVLVPSPSIERELRARDFRNVTLWSRGVDTELFHPRKKQALPFEGPILLYVGRLAVEKNIEAFLQADAPGTKLVVGDGPALKQLVEKFPQAVFLGAKFGEDLAAIYASADVFVFPSKTDTYGLVMLEAMASGVPVAGFRVPGPLDVVEHGRTGFLTDTEDLTHAIRQALPMDRKACREFALANSWAHTIAQFKAALCEFQWLTRRTLRPRIDERDRDPADGDNRHPG